MKPIQRIKRAERPYISYCMQLCWEKLVRGTYEICNRLQACARTRVDTRQAVRRVRVDLGGSWKLTGTETIHRTATCYPYVLDTSVFSAFSYSLLSSSLQHLRLMRSHNYSYLVKCCILSSFYLLSSTLKSPIGRMRDNLTYTCYENIVSLRIINI